MNTTPDKEPKHDPLGSDEQIITLSNDAFDRFEQALSEPRKPNPALAALMNRPKPWAK
ncbi:DUF1778 domain-containing protein [Pseudomonas luteola]